MADIDPVTVGRRLREVRGRRRMTLTEVSGDTGISVSTLSRLESGARRATLELLVALARTYRVTLDELVDAPETGDPRVTLKPAEHPHGTVIELTTRVGGPRAFKMVLRPDGRAPDPRSHEGYDWIYVLDGRLRLVLGEHDVVLTVGEVAEFDTRTPHWFGCADDRPVELLSIMGPQGERMHVRARPKRA